MFHIQIFVIFIKIVRTYHLLMHNCLLKVLLRIDNNDPWRYHVHSGHNNADGLHKHGDDNDKHRGDNDNYGDDNDNYRDDNDNNTRS